MSAIVYDRCKRDKSALRDKILNRNKTEPDWNIIIEQWFKLKLAFYYKCKVTLNYIKL